MPTEPANAAVRRSQLQAWIDEKFAGVQNAFLADIAARTGTPANQGELSGLLSGKKSFGEKKARKLEGQAGMPAGWLDRPATSGGLTGPRAAGAQNISIDETGQSYVRFPLLEGFAGMGPGDYVADYPEVVESLRVAREWVERKLPGVPPEAIRVITGRGDSMKGQYNDGDLIFIDTRVKAFDQDSAYCFRWEGRVLVKRLQFVGRGMLRILSKNADYPAIDAPIEDIQIGGRAIAAWTLREF
ncbi:helix-turn-helix transcriptional regulator [Luteibacter flocculans]|uniref:Helix-turn-helix transcriptional regulator n=1 Tax=Luteibacter flocculans TaxID=2780091 RepID=A0ABY4TA53_9GAMM|nr:S24 family peptidase [Luteibacter flocculans]URL59596.1 helix-turn-helix transcriptional regulator [Luteibacter flocculans]